MGYRSELYTVVGLIDLPEFDHLLKETDLAACFEEQQNSLSCRVSSISFKMV